MGLYLVTGGAGFIGSHLVEALVLEGRRVRVVDNLSTGRLENLADVLSQIDFVEADLADPLVALKASADVETVFHLAALPSVQRSVDDPVATHHAAATATVHVLDAARKAGVGRVVYAASSSVYGGLGEEMGQSEGACPAPRSPYAVAKLAGEYYARAFADCYGLETICLRLFNVFGPRQRPDSAYAGAVPRFCSLMLKGESPIIHGDGKQSRDFTFVENVVAALQLAAVHAIPGSVFNIGTGKAVTLLEIVERLNELLGTRIEPIHRSAKPGDVRASKADIRQAQGVLGYRVAIPFQEGLERTLAWCRNQSRA